MEPGNSKIEKMLGVKFESDPRASRFPLPAIPPGYVQQYPGHPYAIPFEITPEIARDWLTYRVIRREVTPRDLLHDNFAPNRKFIPAALTGSPARKGWIQTFLDGDIRRSHQGIAFSPDGFLLDGQHRLAACLLSGVSYEPLVSQLVPWNAFTAMDDGRTRSANQFIDLPHPNLCAAAARYILPVINGVENREYYAKLATKDQVLDLVYGWGLFAGPWTNEITLAAKGSNIPNTALAASVMMALAAGGDEVSDDVQQFLNGLKSGFSHRDYITIGDNGEDPRWILTNRFLRSKTDRKRTFSSEETYGNVGLIRRCLQVWMDKEEVKATTNGKSPLNRTPLFRDLPKVWRADDVRAFHAAKVG